MDTNSQLMEWIDKDDLAFRIKDPHEVAQLWGLLKGSNSMSYGSFSRSIRYHYGKGALEKVTMRYFLTKGALPAATKFTANLP